MRGPLVRTMHERAQCDTQDFWVTGGFELSTLLIGDWRIRCHLGNPSRWLGRRARGVIDRMLAAGRIDSAEHAHASAELERYLAGASGDDEPPEES